MARNETITENRFYSLDAMRGIAALAVVWLHIGTVTHTYTPHAYLAVDFFFVLSGFVLELTYGERLRLNTLTPKQFLLLRIFRLYPLYLVGLILGLVVILGQRSAHSSHALDQVGAALAFATNLFMLPAVNTNVLFPFNGPAWTLFCELVANVLLGLALAKLKNTILRVFCGAALLVLIISILPIGNIDGGVFWSSFTIGMARVLFSFPLGMILARLFGSRTKTTSIWSIAIMLILATILICHINDHFVMIYDATMVIAIMPWLMWLGAKFELPPIFRTVARVLGDSSYALYAIHYPLLQIVAYVFIRHMRLPIRPVCFAYIVSVLLLSWLLGEKVDVPIRNRLKKLFARVITERPKSTFEPRKDKIETLSI